MKRGPVLVSIAIALTGCNQVFDLQPTVLPPPDAAPRCPDMGSAPAISRRLVQVVRQSCTSYTFSATGRALASCALHTDPYFAFEEGALDDTLQPIALVHPQGFRMGDPRLSADGNEAWLDNFGTSGHALSVFRRTGELQWTWERDLSIADGVYAVMVGLYDAPGGRHLLVQVNPTDPTSTLVERADDGTGTWPIVLRTTSPADMGLEYFDVVGISPDGLRLVFSGDHGGATRIFYADRPDASAAFSTALEIPNVPDVTSLFVMTQDCTRVYFSALQSVFYSTQ
ncbi:MAG TPA: hypothetical protein VLB44_04660 [Kofleriaceae bacterium]|nr:hypothetical protein [Kofleriaceae bacterium]